MLLSVLGFLFNHDAVFSSIYVVYTLPQL